MDDKFNPAGAPSDPAPTATSLTVAIPVFTTLNRVDGWSFAITTLCALVVYLFTLPPEVTLDNSGMLITAGWYGGVAYSPGYPIWTIYSWLCTQIIPCSNIALRITVGSAIAGALASGITALIVSCGGKFITEESASFDHLTLRERKWLRAVCGYVAGMGLGLSGVAWSKAVVADIWTVSLLLFTAILCLSLRWMMNPERKRLLCGGFLLLGFLLASDQEMIVLLPGLIFIAMLGDRSLGRDLAITLLPLGSIVTAWNSFSMWSDYHRSWNLPICIIFGITVFAGIVLIVPTRRFGSSWRVALVCHLCFILGLLLSLYLAMAAMTNPPMNWGYARTVEGFFHAVSRGQYDKVYPTHSLNVYVTQIWMFVKVAGNELGWLYLLLAAFALCKIFRVAPRMRRWLFALLGMFVCAGLIVIAELNCPPAAERQMLHSWMDFFLPALATLSVLAGLGLILSLRLVRRASHSTMA
jgi:hypothetical protein